jgi:hypothetical protein
MILKKGKFYDGDKEVPLEHGNVEQFKLLERVQQLIKVGDESCVFIPATGPGISYDGITFDVKCVCGEIVSFPYADEMGGKKKACSCGLKYFVVEDDECMLTIKLKS